MSAKRGKSRGPVKGEIVEEKHKKSVAVSVETRLIMESNILSGLLAGKPYTAVREDRAKMIMLAKKVADDLIGRD